VLFTFRKSAQKKLAYYIFVVYAIKKQNMPLPPGLKDPDDPDAYDPIDKLQEDDHQRMCNFMDM